MFPRFYRRYTDDIFVIQNRRMFDVAKNPFEKKMNSIKQGAVRFTIERQNDRKLALGKHENLLNVDDAMAILTHHYSICLL